MHSYFRHPGAPLVLLLLSLAAPALGGSLDKLFAPGAQLWSRWSAQDAGSTRSIDHRAWGRFLSVYVKNGGDGVARVAYGRVSSKDRRVLADYIDDLASVPVSRISRAEQLAYWINLYNALTVKTVLDHYPVKSIRDIDLSSGLFGSGPWKAKQIVVEGQKVSLDDIEHRILRPIWKDPRIHYAVNCASIGCPDLQKQAFTARNAQGLLDKAARDYINHPRAVGVSDGRLVLSSIYNWFEGDFAADGGVMAHIKRYASPSLAAKLKGLDAADDYTYDWRLNDAR